jgi:hypothetical protein
MRRRLAVDAIVHAQDLQVLVENAAVEDTEELVADTG